MDIDQEYKDLIEIAANLNVNDISEYILTNPLNLDSRSLQFLGKQLLFNSKLNTFSSEWLPFASKLLAPKRVSLEQSSSEFTSNYKANLISGNMGADLTGGMGVDSYYFAKRFETFVYNDSNTELQQIVAHNFNVLGVNNVEFANTTAEDYLEKTTKVFDFIYLDPSRRDENNRKVFTINDCQPNVLEMKEKLILVSKKIMVKFSPLIDLNAVIKELGVIQEIHILGIKNEVKEVVLLLEEKPNYDPEIKCVNLESDNNIQEFKFRFSKEKSIHLSFTDLGTYLYEPNATILKSGAFKSIAVAYRLNKIATNSHLYTSLELVEDFPGRIFNIKKTLKYDKKQILAELKNKQANVTKRNFPISTAEIKKRLDIKDGGEVYLFFTEDHLKNKIVLNCEKISDFLT